MTKIAHNKYIHHMKYLTFIFKNPVIFLRIIKNYILIFFFKKRLLRITDMAITFKCNANCPHCCSAKLLDPTRKPLELNEIKKCIDDAIQLGSLIFNLLGGEPLVHKEIYNIIRYIKSRHAIAGLSTNGLLLNGQTVTKLKEAGLDVIQVDVESINPEELDSIRSVKGSFDKIIKGIHLLKKAKIKVIMSTILTKKNVANGEIWKIIELAKELDVLINVNCSAKVGNWANDQESLLSEEEQAIFQKVKEMKHTRWAGSTNYLGEYCPCGTEKIYITAYGDVIPCGLISVSYGNILQTPLKDIWENMYHSCNKRRNQKSCRAAFDNTIVDINQYIHQQNRQLPLPYNELPNKDLSDE